MAVDVSSWVLVASKALQVKSMSSISTSGSLFFNSSLCSSILYCNLSISH